MLPQCLALGDLIPQQTRAQSLPNWAVPPDAASGTLCLYADATRRHPFTPMPLSRRSARGDETLLRPCRVGRLEDVGGPR